MPSQLKTREAVLRAVAEFDSLGRDAFLDRYGFRASTRYLLQIDGKEYDSKAIVGVAYAFEHPDEGPLRSDQFTGGVFGAGAAAQLVRLGFEIVDASGVDVVGSATSRPRRARPSSAPTPSARNEGPTVSLGAHSTTMIVIPCSGAKRPGQHPGSGPGITNFIDPALAAELEDRRNRLVSSGGFDTSQLAPAMERYSGALYQAAGPSIRQSLTHGGHVVILSGGYGVARADEAIGSYDRVFAPGDWPRQLAGRVLASYAERNGITRVVAFLARTTSYAKVVRGAAWPDQVCAVDLVSAAHQGGGGMRVVPETLGEALGQFLESGVPAGWRSARGVGVDVERVVHAERAVALDPRAVVAELPGATRLEPGELERDRSRHPSPGLYAWFGDAEARRLIGGALGQSVGELLYVGQAGATRWPSGSRSRATLGRRIGGQHVGGNVSSSTFRRTLAAVLHPALGLRIVDGVLDEESERRLSDFIRTHLQVAVLPVADVDGLGELEAAVVQALDPPLNLDHVQPTAVRKRLTKHRSLFSRRTPR